MFRPSSVFAVGLAVLWTVAAAVPARAAPQDIQVGQVRATQTNTKNGTALREEPSPVGKRVAALPYGTMVRIDRVQAGWVQVTVVAGGTGAGTATGQTGWMKAGESVEPALLGPRAQVNETREGARTVGAEVASAAGRRLGPESERAFRATNADLERAYPIVDRLEAANESVAPEAVDTFIQQGRLARPTR